MTRCLVVANRSMGGRKLREHLLRLHVDDPHIEFHVVVPARGVELYELSWATGFGMPTAIGTALEEGMAPVQARLDEMLARMGSFGVRITGELGPAPPMAAIEAALRDVLYDCIVVSTLPDAFSRWLRMDLPRRTQRRFGLPVTTVIHDVSDTDLVGSPALGTTPVGPGLSERAVFRLVAREHSVQVLVADADALTAVRTVAALEMTGLCSIHGSRTPNETLAYLRGEGRFAGRAHPDLVVVTAEGLISAGLSITDLNNEINLQHVALLLVDDTDSDVARHLADDVHAWAFMPLAATTAENAELLEMMLIELAVLEHRPAFAAPRPG